MYVPHWTKVVLGGCSVQPGVNNRLIGEDVSAEMNQSGVREEGGGEVSQLDGLQQQPARPYKKYKVKN